MGALFLRIGWFDLVAPAAVWFVVFVAATVIADVLLFRWARRRLRAAGRKLGVATAVMAVLQLALLPLAAGYFAVVFSLHRSVAAIIEDAGGPIVERVTDGAALELYADLRGEPRDQPIDVATIRARIARRRDETERALVAKRHRPPLAQVDELLERAWFTAVDRVLERAGDRITRADLRQRAVQVLTHELLKQVADRFRQGARVALYLFLGAVGLFDGATALAVFLVTRRRPA